MKYSAALKSTKIPLHKKWLFPLRISSVNVYQSRSFLQMESHLLKKSLMKNFTFCAVFRKGYAWLVITLGKWILSFPDFHLLYEKYYGITGSILTYVYFVYSATVQKVKISIDIWINRNICSIGTPCCEVIYTLLVLNIIFWSSVFLFHEIFILLSRS